MIRLLTHLCLVSIVAGPIAAAQGIVARPVLVDHHIAITSLPFTIDKCGTYVLKKCLTGSAGNHGVVVQADDVTIDLQGYAITGVAGSLTGVHLNGAFKRLTVRNGNISSWGVNGIDAVTGTDVRIQFVNATDNVAHGIVSGSRATVENCLASDNGIAGILGQKRVCVRHCVTENNPVGGVRIDERGLVVDCLAQNNGEVGILAGPLSTVRGSHSFDNAGNPGLGIRVVEAGQVIDCLAFNNAGNGITVGGRSAVRGCGSHQNGGRGISAADASVVIDSVANGNGTEGIYANAFCVVRDSIAHSNQTGIRTLESLTHGCVVIGNIQQGVNAVRGDAVRDCLVSTNIGHGIVTGQDGLIAGNLVRNNGMDGFGLGGLPLAGILATQRDARISDNHVIQNAIGISAVDAFNTIYKNSVRDNVANFNVNANSDLGPITSAQETDINDFPFGNIVPVINP